MSFNRTRNAKGAQASGAQVHHAPSGQVPLPPRAGQLYVSG